MPTREVRESGRWKHPPADAYCGELGVRWQQIVEAYRIVSTDGWKPYFTPKMNEHRSGVRKDPSAIKSFRSAISPESNSSSSGRTPAPRINTAIIRTLRGVLITTSLPEFMVLRSSVQISGFSSATCATRGSGGSSVVPGAATFRVLIGRQESPAGASGKV